jgi:type IV secretion system protein VirB10
MADANGLNARTPDGPECMARASSEGDKYRPRNKPLSNRIIVVIAAVGAVMLTYVLMNVGDGQDRSARERELTIANVVGASDSLPFIENAAPPAEDADTAITLREDGTLGPPGTESGGIAPPHAEESAKRNIRIVQRPPTDSYRQSRNKMIDALYAGPEVRFETPDENTGVSIEKDTRDDPFSRTDGTAGEGRDQEWESIYRNSPLFTQASAGGQGDANATAMAHQDRNAGFVSASTGTRTGVADEYVPNTRRSPVSKYELKAGSIISGVMMGGINSDLPGTIVGQVSEHVYDTATGGHLLIPQGSRIVGTYDSHVVFGQNRILVVWGRIVYPDGTSLNLEGMSGADQSGYAGFKQKKDNHYSRLVGAALFASVFASAGKIATEDDENQDGAKTEAANAVMETMADLGARLAERHLNVAPTLRILPGYRFAIICTRDIAFAEPYYIP